MNHLFHQGRRPARHGMVLLEVVIALFIFTMVSLSLMMMLDTAMDAARERNEIDTAMRGMERQLALIHAAPIAPLDKDLPDDDSGLVYHLTIEAAQMQDQKKQPVPGMFQVTVTAKWTSGEEAEDRSVSELIYQP